MRAWLAAILAACTTIGCLSGVSYDTTAEPPEPLADSADTYTLSCPSVTSYEPQPGVCASTIGGPDREVAEPDAASHPTMDGVVAMGVNTNTPVGGSGLPSIPPGDLAAPSEFHSLYTSTDWGATWTSHVVPMPEGTTYAGDPSIAFSPDGILHVSFLIREDGTLGVMHAATPDLGESWTGPTVVEAPRDADRNWLSVMPNGDVYIAWMEIEASTVHVALSHDAGRTWTRVPPGGIPYCNINSHVVPTPQGPILACNRFNTGRGSETAVFRIDVTNRSIVQIASLPPPRGTIRASAGPNGTIMLARPADVGTVRTAFVHLSTDGGRTWTPGTDVRGLTDLDDAWTWAWLSEAEPDPWGGVHVMMVGGEEGDPDTCRRGNEPGACAEHRQVVWLAFDASTSDVRGQALLTGPPGDTARRPIEPIPDRMWDDFHTAVFGADRGMLAWGHDRAVDVTIIETA